ncbi:MAG TPA: penicillin-binding transpeptidase domain-containing protein [Bryobacteraceae bacterium]|nr:penicillin-binding transpeptidase domain-containing protein [Bryobacteraceae bacterium]
MKAGVAANPARKRRITYSRWTEPNYADSAAGDILAGEDLVVRQAALAALGLLNGTVVVVDPNTGRILTIVNQKLAFQSGFQPCSTVKVFTALAALSEGLIGRTSPIRVSKRTSMNLTEALAVSNNPYFAALGQKLGFERVRYYGRLFGLGETAGLGIAEEEPGILPEMPPANGGVGMMTSFGEGITLTPLELASLLSAIANGGTMYYLQHPRSQAELDYFIPRVKRNLDIQPFIPEVKPGLLGATEFGTARRASYSADEPIYGKTGTCTDRRSSGTHLGWFGSFNEVGGKKLVVVVLLTGGSAVSGPVASGVAGAVYRNLSMSQFFARESTPSPATLNVTGTCCVE